MANNKNMLLLLCGFIYSLSLLNFANASYPYYGTKIGALTRLHHGVSGDVYAVDSRTIFIKKFNYDGEAPAAYFYVGNTDKPSNEGAFRVRDERGDTASLTRRYRNKDITLSLPEGKTLRDIKWFSVWCDEFAVNFGDVTIPSNLDFPRPQRINPLKGVHGVASDNIVIVDAQTLLVPNFSYDGEAPDAKFWVGRGQRPTSTGLRIPDENGKENPLRRYDRKTIVLTLPEDLTIFDIGHFGVWCEAFTVDFGHVRIPEGLNVPPSLKMLGISPQSKLNCEVLYDDLAFEVRWAVAGESIVVQLVAKLEPDNYMSFGVSRNNRTEMIGGDVVVAWVDKDTGKGYAQDYFLDDKSQCSGGRGTCPDVNIKDNTNSIRLLNAAMVNGYSIVTYQRALQPTDSLDLPILINDSQAVIWAVGPLNERKEASFHTRFTRNDHFINFGRQPTWNCPMPEGMKMPVASSDEDVDNDNNDNVNKNAAQDVAVSGYPPARKPANEPEEEFYDNRAQALQGPVPNRRQGSAANAQRGRVPTPKPVNGNDDAWDIPAIQCYEPEDGVFYAQMGPTGGKHGYPAITGHVGWGISWYINGLLIPEIHVVRGKTYTFVVEGGNNPDIPAKYHPFYISDDPVGGYEHKREEEKKAVRIYAGVHRSRSGQMTPTGVGRLCNWTPDVDGPPADDYQSFGAYQRTLTLKCDAGEPGVITWKPDRNTPDTVYYHCFTHRYLGWKIHVHDSCDDARYSASDKHEIRVPSPAAHEVDDVGDDFDTASSVRHESKVSNPNVDNFLLKHQTDLIKNHNMNGTPPKMSFEITKSSEITKLISDGIRAAEALEESLIRNQQQQQQSTTSNNSSHNNNNKKSSHLLPGAAPQGSTAVGSQNAAQFPAQPYITAAKPEILHGETNVHLYPNTQYKLPIFASPQSSHALNTLSQTKSHLHMLPPFNRHHLHNNHLHHTHLSTNNITSNLPAQSQKTIGLSEFLRPPHNAPLYPYPVKLPVRRPYIGAPVKKVPSSAGRPVLPQQHPPRHTPLGVVAPVLPNGGAIAQPSLIVNHYRKPVPGLLKPFFKEKPFPIQSIAASVLLLGQPTELNGVSAVTAGGSGGQRKHDPHVPHVKKQKPIGLPVVVEVPYSDLEQQSSLQSAAYANSKTKQQLEKKNIYGVHIKSPILPKNTPVSSVLATTSQPLIKNKQPALLEVTVEEPTAQEIATMRPAVNHGFQPNSVVVESGFRPILRNDGTDVELPPEAVDQVAHRREDPGTEIDEVMETDTLFLTAQKRTETQNFEPMFIPSPLDSTNTSVILRKVSAQTNAIASALRLPSAATTAADDAPIAEKLRKPSLEELFEDIGAVDSDSDDATATEPSSLNESTKDTVIEPHKATNTVYDDMEDEFIEDEIMDEMDAAAANDTDDVIELEDGEDKVAAAAERIDTYYLPPDNRKIPHANIPSGAVITYDGKSVIDSSLVLPPKLDSHEDFGTYRRQFSPLEQLIRTTPQFGIYRGELPPSIPEFLSTERSALVSYTSSPIANRGSLSTSSASAFPISTKAIHQSQSSFETRPSSSTLSLLPTRPISTKLQLLKTNSNT